MRFAPTAAHPYLVVAWHDVPRIVHEVLPRLFADDSGAARVNVIDEDGRVVFGPPMRGGDFTVGRPFPTTLYNWRLQVTLTSAQELGARVERRRVLGDAHGRALVRGGHRRNGCGHRRG